MVVHLVTRRRSVSVLVNVVVEFPGIMPLMAEVQIHYRPVLELKVGA